MTYGIRPATSTNGVTVFQWFSSYLTDRTHYVSLCNHCTDFAPVHSGVPQCSVLGHYSFHHVY